MANRHTLHISKLEDFKAWLVKDGWGIDDPKEIYEVLRVRKPGRKNPLIIYTKADAKEHLSVMDKDSGVVGAFLRDMRKPQTNADRIRAMTDEELAEFLDIVEQDGIRSQYSGVPCDCCMEKTVCENCWKQEKRPESRVIKTCLCLQRRRWENE